LKLGGAMKLDEYLSHWPELRVLYQIVKQDFSKRGLVHHNWNHILRDLATAIIVGEAEKANMKIILAGEVVRGETGTAMCQTLIVKPFLQNKPYFSIGDPGGTYGVGLSSQELMVSLPYSLLNDVISTLQRHIKNWKAGT
jgi:hypothetical protein